RANAVVRAWREKRPIEPIKIGYTVAEGLAAGDPGKKGAWALAILEDTGGVAGDAEDEEILEAQRLLARTEGIGAGPTGVAALAVLQKLLAAKALDPDATICVVLSETGLKTEAPPPRRDAVAFDEDSLRRLVREKLGGRREPDRRPELPGEPGAPEPAPGRPGAPAPRGAPPAAGRAHPGVG